MKGSLYLFVSVLIILIIGSCELMEKDKRYCTKVINY